ncbi:MAG: hypothetical protein AB8B51_01860 [Sedimentitalea sp.]
MFAEKRLSPCAFDLRTVARCPAVVCQQGEVRSAVVEMAEPTTHTRKPFKLVELERDRPAYNEHGKEVEYDKERKLKIRAERIAQALKNEETLGNLAPSNLMASALGDAFQTTNGLRRCL